MSSQRDIEKLVWTITVLAVVALLATPWLESSWASHQYFVVGSLWLDVGTFSTPWFSDWLTALGVLLALILSSQLLALRITEGGSTTTMDFVPHFGAILLLGPTGSALLAIVSDLVFQFRIARNPKIKAIFNTAQIVLTVLAASWVYLLLGGRPSLLSTEAASAGLPFNATLPPFFAAVLTYFGTNTTLVSLVISRSQDARFSDVWNSLSGRLIIFDIAMSPLGFLVAYLYIQFGAITLLLALIPIIGLRYSYGVNLELQQLNTDLVRVLIRTIESQDPYTGGHSLRVSKWAVRIAEEAKVGYQKRQGIETAALLHDIGKIHRRYYQILRQKGPLSAKQRELIQRHPDRGVEMLSPVRSLDPDILSYIRHHHEHFDGGGYPAGLLGDDIPLGARIIMIADTVDAMMTQRPYRDPLPPRIVRQELIDKKGQQFDPDLVDIVLESDVFSQMAQAYTQDTLPFKNDVFDELSVTTHRHSGQLGS